MTNPPEMKRGYVICGYARTGSTMLARALQSTGKLGHPQEYFNPQAIETDSGQTYPKAVIAQIAEIARRGTSDNGIYGLKIFCDQFDALGGFDWASRLPNLQFIHLERRDTLLQAISWVRATQSVQWTSGQPQRGQLMYDEPAILGALTRFSYDRARWTMFFARNGIVPLNLVYEDMIDDLSRAVQAIAHMFGLDEVCDLQIGNGAEQLAIQRDEMSQEWRNQFLASRRNRSILDKPVGRSKKGIVHKVMQWG
jgi:trehalose 2-sulfotransferase